MPSLLSKLPLLIFFASLWACAADKPEARLQALEAAYARQALPARADSLVALYREAVKAQPEDHTSNVRYLTRAADLQWRANSDAVSAARWLHDAVVQHGQGQDLRETAGVMARLWNSYLYKSGSTARLDPDDIDKLHADLLKHQAWVDSCLATLEKDMGTPVVKDPSKVPAYLDIAEARADLWKQTDPKKAGDLLLQAAGLAKSVGNFNKAIQLYYAVAAKMPQHPKAASAQFMIGFIYANDLGDLDKAKAAYESFLKQYPEEKELVAAARTELSVLGKSPEEMVRGFEQKAAQQPR